MPTTMILEALSAVDRLITARTERNLSSLATVGTYHFEHFTSTVGTTALAIFTISDEIYSGRELSAEDRQKSFTKMMELALETAV